MQCSLYTPQPSTRRCLVSLNARLSNHKNHASNYSIALRLLRSYPGATSLLTLNSVCRIITSGSLRWISLSRSLLASLMLKLPPPPWYQGAVPVSDVADAVAVAVAVAREVRSGRRRRGCVDDVCEAGEMGRRETWEVVS